MTLMSTIINDLKCMLGYHDEHMVFCPELGDYIACSRCIAVLYNDIRTLYVWAGLLEMPKVFDYYEKTANIC